MNLVNVNYNLVIECLQELSSQEVQTRLGLSTSDSERTEVSYFIKARKLLFNDSRLGDALKTHSTGLGERTQKAIMLLEQQLVKVNYNHSRDLLIPDPIMQNIRDLAHQALELISSDNNTREVMDVKSY